MEKKNEILSAASEAFIGDAAGMPIPIMTLYTANCRGDAQNTSYPNAAPISSARDLAAAVGRDHMASRMRESYRTAGNFLDCDCIMVDVDNTHSEEPYDWKTEKDIAEAFPFRYFLVRSRNYLKEKRKRNRKTGIETIYAPREKWHIYIPLRKAIRDAGQFRKLILAIEALFPWIDPGAMDEARFFFGVLNPHVTWEDNGIFADDYLLDSANAAEIREQQQTAVEEFLTGMKGSYTGSKENYTTVQRICSFIGIPAPSSISSVAQAAAPSASADRRKAAAPDQAPEGLEWITDTELDAQQAKSIAWLERWALTFGVTLGGRYTLSMTHMTHPGAICICVDCPWKAAHTEDTGEKQTVIIIDRGGKINFLCRHGHCAGRSWTDFRAYYEAKGPVNPVPIAPEQNDSNVAAQTTADEQQSPEQPIKFTDVVSAADLLEMDVPDPVAYIGVGEEVPLLCEGTCILSAKPKCGKSWLALAMCIAVANGEDFLGYRTKKCRTLYLDLESGKSIRKKRLKKAVVGHEVPSNFDFIGTSQTLDSGLLEQIENYLKDYPDTGLIVIDVFEKIRTAPLNVRESDYRHAYRDLDPLNGIADKHHISIIVVSHNRKAIDLDDPYANILGSTGLQAAITQMIVLQKRRSEGIIQLFVQGRSQDGEIKLGTKLDDGQWTVVDCGNSGDREKEQFMREYMDSIIRKAVVAIANAEGSWKGRCGAIIDAATQQGIGIMESPKVLGSFLHKHQARFLEQDGIRIQFINNGSGSKIYKIEKYDPEMEKALEGFIKM